MKPFLYIIAISSVLFTSCVKKTLYDEIDETKIIVQVNRANMSQNSINNNIAIMVDNEYKAISENNQLDTIVVTPGNHEVYVHSIVPGITVNNGVAKIDTVNNGSILSVPNTFYAALQNITTEPGSITKVDITPEQCTRQLIIFTDIPPYGIINTVISVSGTLNNVASSFNLKTKKEENATSITFDIENDSCAIEVFGTIGDFHEIVLNVLYKYDTIPRTMVADVSTLLQDFNSTKSQPKVIVLDGNNLNFKTIASNPFTLPNNNDKLLSNRFSELDCCKITNRRMKNNEQRTTPLQIGELSQPTYANRK